MQVIDYESFGSNKLLEFSVRVQDPIASHFDTTTVKINVTDANDNAPVINPPRMTVNVSESIAVGATVFDSFSAVDSDLDENSRFA